MKVLIVDRDRLASQALQTQLESEGHSVMIEPVRSAAMDLINQQSFDVIAIDPAPLASVRQMTLPLRWEQRADYFYLVLMGHDLDDEEVVRSGMNDRIQKPFAAPAIQQTMANAARLSNFMNRLQAGSAVTTDPRIFAPRIFYQLVLSALDRAYRYGEQAYLLSIRITNLDLLRVRLGDEQARNIVFELGNYLGKLHRISDFLGHTDEAEFVLLLLRPAVDREPQDAAERFTIALQDFQSQISQLGAAMGIPEFSLELWILPSAAIAVQTQIGR